MTTITAFKAFEKDWSCKGFMYGEPKGQTYTHDGPLEICVSGFHACEAPMDVLDYYPLDSQFAQVELGEVSDERQKDTKRVGKTITIKATLSIPALISAQIEWTFANAKDESKASGDSSTAASSGNYSTAASSGNYSKAACDTNGFACVAGSVDGCVKGNAGSALSLGYKDASGKNRIAVGYVGENGILPDIWYGANEKGELVRA